MSNDKRDNFSNPGLDPPPPPYSSSESSQIVPPNESTRLHSPNTKHYSATPNLTYHSPQREQVHAEIPQPLPLFVEQSPVLLQDLRTEPCITICPHCKQIVLSSTKFKSGSATYLTSLTLLVLGLTSWGCCLIPFCVNNLKDCVHSCPKCGKVMAKYSRIDGKVYRHRE
ncbi:1913_t:CDS:2 [Diversispora eburnea]|uniref:1913_t:CDS:1 n=1 Tax=Diversispora eburnea TaxID=1213867 RepID=A0A9N8YSF7_9GLOM|nr:1913_t:CDS:2 [Diversispora eburnea]